MFGAKSLSLVLPPVIISRGGISGVFVGASCNITLRKIVSPMGTAMALQPLHQNRDLGLELTSNLPSELL